MASQLVASIGRHPHSETFFENPHELADGTRLEVQEGGHAPSTVKMLRDLEFDVCELPLINYIAAKERGLEATAIAVFPTRRFVHWMVEVPEESSIREPKDLEGKRIVSNYFGNTDSVWSRGVLAEDYGVDLSRVTWVTVREERVLGAKMPEVELVLGASPAELLASGAVDARFNGHIGPDPGARTLWSDPERAAAEWYSSSRYFPTLHTVIVKDAAFATHERLARDLYNMFEAAKRTALVKSEFGKLLSSEERIEALDSGFAGASVRGSDRDYLGEDPIPYGLEPNRQVLERLIRYAVEQGAIRDTHEVEELFAPTGG